jgi:signal transduction histidine kinase
MSADEPRYYNPTLMPCLSSNDNDKPTPRASSDPCLTAFAQLGALRFNCRRGIITVSTRNTEYVLAESGQKLSLQDDDDEDDKLWHGVGLLQSEGGIAPEVVKLFSEADPPSHILIGDLTKHERFKDKKIVVEEPHVRAMACVPLRSPLHNVVIGTYVVVDDRVREPLSGRDLQFLTDMATTIMDYLEAGRVKRQQFRAERMVKAIGLFIEGKATLREWWLESGHRNHQSTVKKRDKDTKNLAELADKEFGVQEGADYFSRDKLHGLRAGPNSQPQSPSSAPTSTAPSESGRGDGRPLIPTGDPLLSASDSTVISPNYVNYDGRPSIPRGESDSTLLSRSWQERNSSVTTFDTDHHTPDPEKHHQSSVSFDLPPENPIGQEVSKELQNAILTSDVRGVFARASNLIREAIGVEGVIYFDASVGSFGGSSEKNVMEEKAPGAFHADQALTTSEDDLARRSSDTDGMDPPKMEPFTPQNADIDEKYCNILGFSTRKRSSLRGHQATEEQQRMPETVLRKLLKRYPHGKVFNFDEEGSFSASESDHPSSNSLVDASTEKTGSDHVKRRNRFSREQEAAAILSVLPRARSVFWFPLWDQNRERWFSGSLVWSTCPTRTLCPLEDITYLAAFGNSTMAEISRLSAQVLSKMKTDFISSISHELRSPLHGVLASVEFLQETKMTEIQADMVSNIHASGKVLLDTINHVLDFSKVNRKSKNKRRVPKRRRQKFGRRESVDDGGEEKADICVLSEEVIESIYAGQSISKKALGLSGHRRQISAGHFDQPVTVIVDIQWRPNWTFEIDAGAFRRVIMNLFSNAMKYTKAGFVKISLVMEEDVASQKSKSRQNLVLRVEDSGKGISQEFLKHQLFKPFTQEDSLATGAGLGLSIVKAIVQDLGGRIEFQSEPGSGTEALVRIPLTERLPKADSLKLIGDVRQFTKGLKFNLQCFDMFPDIAETPTGILSSTAEAAMLLKSTVQSTLTTWFEMEEIGSSVAGSQTADVCVIMEAGLGDKSLDDMLEAYHQDHPDMEAGEKLVAIVLTSSYHSGPKVDAHEKFHIYYLQQP